MILLLRANHANEFELQNYRGINNLEVITSRHPLTHISLPTKKLWSPTDLPAFPYRRELLNRLFGGEQWLFGLENHLKHKRYNDLNHDIVHTAETYTPYTHQAVQLRQAGKIAKLVCTCWETIPHNNEKFARLRKWKQEAYRSVDTFHTPTNRAKQALVTEGVDPAKIIVIPYGVDLTRFRPSPVGALAKEGHRPSILTVARPVPEKGTAIYKAVSSRLSDLADFRWISTATYHDMPAIYQSADLFFLPSRTTKTWEEQYGMCLVEAMACGLPIVATGSGSIPEVVGDAGIPLAQRDVDKMVKTIRRILTHPEEKRRLSQLSLARAKVLFDAAKIAPQLATLYH